MHYLSSIHSLTPLDTRVKVILYELFVHMKEKQPSWTYKYALPNTGSGYFKITNKLGVLDIRISHHDTHREDKDLYFEYPENKDFDTMELVREIVVYISREFNCKLSLPLKSNMSKLFYVEPKKKRKKNK